MSQITIKQACELGDGALLPNLGPVTFREIYPVRTGTSARTGEPYRVQDGVAIDNTGEVRISIWDSEDASALKGQTRVIHSVKAKNGRLSGVQVKVGKDQKGNNRWEVSISKAALFLEPEATNVPATAPEDKPTEVAKPQSAVVKASELPVQAAKQFSPAPELSDVVELYRQCYEAAGSIFPTEDLQALAASTATIFIRANQLGIKVAKKA